MRTVSASDLVSTWERTLGQPPVAQALALLTLVSPESSMEAMAELTIGERDARLLALREHLFGRQMSSVTICPGCRQRLELTFDVADIRPEYHAPTPGDLALSVGGYRVQFRLPNGADLVSVAGIGDIDAARERLLDRCIQSVVPLDVPEAQTEQAEGLRLPTAVVDAIAARMAEEDHGADTSLSLQCPDCRHQWVALFDIASYLVREVHNRAVHLLREVHTLARAYGWREADILAMSATRRRVYLELAGQS